MSTNEPPDNVEALDRSVRNAVYSEFVKSARAPNINDLSRLIGRTPPQIKASLHRLADAHVLVLDKDDHIRMAMPFSAVPTSFRVATAKGEWFANCAWDALGVPVTLGTDAHIITSCGDCGETVSLEVRSGRLVEGAGVIHFAVPAANWWDDIRYT